MDRVRHLIQILLPLYDNAGKEFGPAPFVETRTELTDRFGGLTAHMRAPARGVWKTGDGEVTRDDVVILEVMAGDLERAWWSDYRARLEARFRQDVVVIRAMRVELL